MLCTMSPLLRSYKICRYILRSGYVKQNSWHRQLPEGFPLTAHFTVDSKSNTYSDLTVGNPVVSRYLDHIVNKYRKIQSGYDTFESNRDLLPLVGLLEERLAVSENLASLDEFGKDPDMKELAAEEISIYQNQLARINEQLLESILENMVTDDFSEVLLEITAGVGGQEAMLFAKDLHKMYLGYLRYLGYDYSEVEYDAADAGGISHSSITVSGDGAFSNLIHEGGVHRVQRIPATERSGRVHTSTVSVAVLPQPTDIEVTLSEKDLKIETKRASGAGGQHINTTESAVRVVHLPTGISAEVQTQRSQLKNKELAMRTLRARIFAKQLSEQDNMMQKLRKNQKGLSLRNEKIRTYNWQQDRITDHRLSNGTVHNLKGFLEGGEVLHKLVESLQDEARRRVFFETVSELQQNDDLSRKTN